MPNEPMEEEMVSAAEEDDSDEEEKLSDEKSVTSISLVTGDTSNAVKRASSVRIRRAHLREVFRQCRPRWPQQGAVPVKSKLELLQVTSTALVGSGMHVDPSAVMAKINMVNNLTDTPMTEDAFIDWFAEVFTHEVLTAQQSTSRSRSNQTRSHSCPEISTGDNGSSDKSSSEPPQPEYRLATLNSTVASQFLPSTYGGDPMQAAYLYRPNDPPEVARLSKETISSLVEFAQTEHLCWENDDEVLLEVLRRGPDTNHEVTIRYHTENVNCHEFEEQRGEVTMAPGEFALSFSISLLDDNDWNTEMKQWVIIDEVVGAELGELRKTLLVALNEDYFPHGLLPDRDGYKRGLGFNLAWNLARHFFAEVGLCVCLQAMLYKLDGPVDWIVLKIVQLQAINHVTVSVECEQACDGDHTEFFWLGAIVGVVTVIVHLAQNQYAVLRLGGKARLSLRRALIETITQLSPDAMNEIDVGSFIHVCLQQVEDSVASVWLGVWNLWKDLVQLCAIIGFSFYSTKGQSNFFAFMMMAAILGGLLILYLRIPTSRRLAKKWILSDSVWVEKIVEVAETTSLFAAYSVASQKIGDQFSAAHADSNKARWNAEFQTLQTKAILNYLTGACYIVTLIWGGYETLDATLTVGAYSTLLSTVDSLTSTLASTLSNVLTLLDATEAVAQISGILNANTRRKMVHTKRTWELALSDTDDESMMRMALQQSTSICLVNMIYEFPHPDSIKTGVTKLNKLRSHSQSVVQNEYGPGGAAECIGPITLVIQQGQMLVISGAAYGKTTLLMIMAKLILPTKGFVIYPASACQRYVQQEPLLLQGTFIENCRFGNSQNTEHPESEIMQLCRELGISEFWLRNPGTQVGRNGSRMRGTDRTLLCLARALLSGVDILLIAGAVDTLGTEGGLRVMDLLRNWVKNRGLAFLSADEFHIPLHMRKRKTVVFATKSELLEGCADATLFVHTHGLTKEATEDLLVRRSESTDSTPPIETPAHARHAVDHEGIIDHRVLTI